MTKVGVHWIPEHETSDVYIVLQVRVVSSVQKEKKRKGIYNAFFQWLL
jgi:hypothetical protein